MTQQYPTPHIDSRPGDFAETVLMPGDPMRAKFAAENYLRDPVLVNNVRGVQGYTGLYNGARVSVMASGMGMPSIAIYSRELYAVYGVENIIRIGSAGGYIRDIKLGDIVIAMGACTDSNYGHQFRLPGRFAPTASFELLRRCVETAENMGIGYTVGNVLSTDVFYDEEFDYGPTVCEVWSKMGVLAVEMEAAALYMNAARAGKKALVINTISDNLVTGEKLAAQEREKGFGRMIELALNTAAGL